MGQGLSAYNESDYSLRQHADTTFDLFEALDLQQPDLLGWSFGGAVALQLAVLYPQAIRRLIVTVSPAFLHILAMV